MLHALLARPSTAARAAALLDLPTGPSVIAAFDVDGTLTEGGSVYPWLAHVGGRWSTVRAAITHAPAIVVAAITSGHRADAVKESVFCSVVGDTSLAEVTERSRSFAAHHVRRALRPATRAQLEWHRARGHTLVLVSASPALYVAAIGQLVGVDHVLATRLAVAGDGTVTGAYDGRNCRGEEKLARLRAFTSEAGTTLVAYGNSRGDLAMLGAAHVGVDCGKLGPLSALKAFPTLASVRALLSATR